MSVNLEEMMLGASDLPAGKGLGKGALAGDLGALGEDESAMFSLMESKSAHSGGEPHDLHQVLVDFLEVVRFNCKTHNQGQVGGRSLLSYR